MNHFLFASILTLAGLSSCIKEYTCTCDTTVADFTNKVNAGKIEDTKKKAQEACDELDVEGLTDCEIN